MTSRRTFALTALALGAAAPFAGSPLFAHKGTVDIDELTRMIQRGADHIDAIELAEWIKERRSGLRVFDLRTKGQFDEGHIPTAESVQFDALATTPIGANETVVLYSEGGAHAGQAWVLLRALGHKEVYFLRSGTYEWLEQVLNPTLATDATDEERTAFERASAMSRYFGGTPERNVPRSRKATTDRDLRRRGC